MALALGKRPVPPYFLLKQFFSVRGLPDMTSASEGEAGHGNNNIGREVA